jgi:tetratricopeptide (TPR) repeat protein
VAVRLGDIVSAIERAESAAELDRLSPRPWLSLQPSTVGLADLWFARMMAEGDGKLLREEFDNACAQAIELDPRSESTYTRVGHFYLILYRRFGQRADLLKARDHYAEAVTRYTNNALTHAQLAWVLHLCGEDQAASEQAELALELDNRHEHSEYKLKEQSLYDQSPATGLDQPEFDPAVRAEPLMQRLRKASTPLGACR